MSSILAIDTSTPACSVALARGGRIWSRHENLPKAHNQHVLRFVNALFEESQSDHLDSIVCGIGPGSFTGLRVAVSLVQGLAWAREIPVVPICSLWAQVISAEAAGLLEGVETCVSTIDAKISQFYQATFTRHGNSWRVTSQPQLTSSFEEVEQGGSIQCVIGSGLLVTAKDVPVIQLESADLSEPDRASRAAVEPNMAAVLAHMVNGGELPAPMAPEDLEPAYVHTEIGWKKIGEQGR